MTELDPQYRIKTFSEDDVCRLGPHGMTRELVEAGFQFISTSCPIKFAGEWRQDLDPVTHAVTFRQKVEDGDVD